MYVCMQQFLLTQLMVSLHPYLSLFSALPSINEHGGHRMTQNRSPSAWPYWTRHFSQKTGYEFITRQMTGFQSFSEGPLRLEGKYREAILEEGSKTFRLLPNMGRFLCFSRHHGFFFQPLFVPIPLIRKGVFFCLH